MIILSSNIIALTNTEVNKFVVAIADDMRSTRWKNKRLSWEELIELAKVPVRSKETVAEFDSLPKERQSELKNVGCFVGGYLEKGRRNKNSLKYRTVLALDADNASADFIEKTEQNLSGMSYIIYSTRTDRPTAHRYRVLIQLDRKVNSDEYEAVGRAIAANIGIDNFDETTFQAERLMFWGSVSQDQEFFFASKIGKPINVNDVLASYGEDDAWKDPTLWARTTSLTDSDFKRMATTQGNPLEKHGIVGAFCRAYTISEAITEFLSDVYAPFKDRTDRYTYVKGHTVGGLVVYNDIFAYAHQNTDPCSGRLCNAYDLVRIQLFGRDEKTAKKMDEWAVTNEKVKSILVKEKHQSAVEAFAGIEENNDWTRKLTVNKQGEIEVTAKNIKLIFDNDKYLKNTFRYDVFKHKLAIVGKLAWRKFDNVWTSPAWTDDDTAQLRNYLDENYGLRGQACRSIIKDTLAYVRESRQFHPVASYLETAKLMWDGKKRAETLLIDYLGAEDNRYNRLTCRKMLLAAVRRIFKPGCTVNHMLILSGIQGCGKTTLIERLGSAWFSNSLPKTLADKDAMTHLKGNWIIEMGELATMRKTDVDSMKNFVTRNVDKYRPPFGELEIEIPRQCVFFGTCNDTSFLTDKTGNRRYWVVPCVQDRIEGRRLGDIIYDTFTPDFVEQIWGEVMNWGLEETLDLPSEMMSEVLEREEQFSVNSDAIALLEDYLDREVPDGWETWSYNKRSDWLIASDSDNAVAVKATHKRNIISPMEIWSEYIAHNETLRAAIGGLSGLRQLLPQVKGWSLSRNKVKVRGLGKIRVYMRDSAVEDLL